MIEHLKIVQAISLLYELSLSVGTSLDFKENTDKFVKVLMTRKNISFASVWLSEEFEKDETSNKYNLAYANPQYQMLDDSNAITDSHIIFELLKGKKAFSLTPEDKNFNKVIQEKNISGGIYAIFRLKDIGFLKLYSIHRKEEFTKIELFQLNNVIEKFAVSTKACFDHAKLVAATKNQLLQTEDDRAKSYDSYKSVGHSLTDGLLITDLKNKIVYANDKISEISGYSKSELVGNIAYELFLPEDEHQQYKDKVKNRIAGIAERYEARFLKKNGQEWYAIVNASPYRNANGQITGAISGITDITEKRIAKFKLEESNRKYRDLFENMSDAFLILGNDGYIKEANKAAKELYGYEPDETISWHISKFIHPEDRIKSQWYFRQLLDNGFYRNYEGRIITKNGDIKHIQVNSDAIIKKGKFEGSRDFIRDITSRKEAEKRLQESENKLRLIIDTALDGVIIINDKNEVTEWNRMCEEIFGYHSSEVLYQELPSIISHHEYKELQIAVVQYIRTQDPAIFKHRMEITGFRKSGERFPVEVSITPIKNENAYFFSAFVRDISERKQAEERREKLLAELEYINQELKEFAYIVSHDLKAPLRAIRSLAEWIEEDYTDVLDEEGRESMTLLKSRVDRMQSFIDGILEYSRIGRIKGSFEQLNIKKLLEELVIFLDPPKHIEVNITGTFPTIYGEKIRIEQLFQNLMSNAIKYNDKEKGIINVSCDDLGDYYQFHIQDNGKGIPKRHFNKIFQIFQTLQARDQYESTGIGLTIVKKIVETYGGVITVVSEVGKGSTFSFTILKKDKRLQLEV